MSGLNRRAVPVRKAQEKGRCSKGRRVDFLLGVRGECGSPPAVIFKEERWGLTQQGQTAPGEPYVVGAERNRWEEAIRRRREHSPEIIKD